MSHQQFLQPVIGVLLVMVFIVGCGAPAATPVAEAPLATPTPEPPTATPTLAPFTATPIQTPPVGTDVAIALSEENTENEAISPGVVLPNTESFAMTSSTNGEDYRIFVGLPLGYVTSEQAYPVLYILDPDVSFGTATEYARLVSPNLIPSFIIVGIGYPTDDVELINEARERDYYSRQEDFLEFISAELIPLIDARYRTEPADRAIMGFSLGGDFTLYAFGSQPELFNRYMSVSPGNLASPLIFSLFRDILRGDNEEFHTRLAGRNVRLMLSAGSREVQIVPKLTGFGEDLKAVNYEGLEVTVTIFEGETHGSILPIALIHGMQTIFSD